MLSPAAPFAFFGAIIFGLVVLFLVWHNDFMPLAKILALLAFILEVWLIVRAIHGMAPYRYY